MIRGSQTPSSQESNSPVAGVKLFGARNQTQGIKLRIAGVRLQGRRSQAPLSRGSKFSVPGVNLFPAARASGAQPWEALILIVQSRLIG